MTVGGPAPKARLDVVGRRPEWQARGACVGLPLAWFFAGRGDEATQARGREVCRGCPVKRECADFALRTGQDHGMWGGLSERARKRLRSGNRRRRAEAAFAALRASA